MSDWMIRAANVEDADGIAYVHVTAWLETYRGLMPDDVLDNLSIEQRIVIWSNRLKDVNDPYHLVLVAEAKGRIMGFASYGKELGNDPMYKGELYAIYVLKEFQGHGIGHALVKQSALGLLTMKISSMLVWVLANNPYQKFYESLGGIFLRERTIQFGAQPFHEKGYGWKDTQPLIA